MDILEELKFDLAGRFGLREKRPGVAQVVLPRYYEDGDMLDVFIDLPKRSGGPVVISDHGCTLMRLSCFCEVHAFAIAEILSQTPSARGIEIRGNVLRMETTPEDLYEDMNRFAQVVEEVSAMRQHESESDNAA